jgi:hypothetical protein
MGHVGPKLGFSVRYITSADMIPARELVRDILWYGGVDECLPLWFRANEMFGLAAEGAD